MNTTPNKFFNLSGPPIEWNRLPVTAFIIVETLVAVFIVIGNGFIISLIQKGQLLGRSTNVFVFSIACADILNAILSIPSHILSTGYSGQLAVYMCKSLMFGLYISKTVVQFTVLFMSVEKSLRILCPTREVVTVARCIFATSLLWFFAPSFNIWCIIFFTTEQKYQTPIKSDFDVLHFKRCVLHPRFLHLHVYFLGIFFTVLFAVPCISIFVLFGILLSRYFTILRERILTYFFVIKLLISLFFVAIICQLPFEIMTIIDNILQSHSENWNLLLNCSELFLCTRGLWNVFVYCYFHHFFTKKRHLATIRASNTIKRKTKFPVNLQDERN